jgi:glycogen operon protein
VVDTAGKAADRMAVRAGSQLPVEARSLVVLQAHQEPEVEPDHSVAASLASYATTAATGPIPTVGKGAGR